MQTLTANERNFINRFQGGFPLQPRPYEMAAEQLHCSEDTLLDTIVSLKNRKLLTRFGPLFDAAALGGGLTLAALAVPEERYDTIAELVNAYPEVAHNYRREHALNMWFVLATETPQEIEVVLQSIEKMTRLPVYNFPKQQEFYIGLWLQLAANNQLSTVSIERPASHAETPATGLDDTDRKLIRATQSGLPLEKTPYRKIADNLGLSQQDVLQRLQAMLESGIIRRIGAVPNHYRLGLTANGMTVWNVSDDMVYEAGKRIGQLDFVSHCYRRPRHLPLWPYNLFAMVHGHSRDEVNEKTRQIEAVLGDSCRGHDTLFSSKILKKTGLRLAA
ncbi:MAG TPA: Lrp/AsnC family transcriptional regulator [Thiotrichales bacterium]|nr:Lrp/AsnC family transcriptional regulator [Thiotrichales bacterium]